MGDKGIPQGDLGNPEEILKVLQATGANSDFTAGGLQGEEMQLDLMWHVRAYSVMLAPTLSEFPNDSAIGRSQLVGSPNPPVGSNPLVPGNVRVETHASGQISGTYDSAHIGDTITTGAVENTGSAEAADANYNYADNHVKFGRRRFECVKLRSSMGMTTEAFVRSVRGGQLNAEFSAKLQPRLGHDFEDLAVNGDTDFAADNRRLSLLRQNDGWVKISLAQAPVINHGADFIEWDLFMEMLKTIPEEVTSTDFRWWMHPHLWFDWIAHLRASGGGAAEATAALAGNGLAPMGIPVVRVPLLPRQRPIAKNAATSARVLGLIPGPFIFKPAANAITLGVDQHAGVAIVFPDDTNANVENRLLTASRVAAAINAALVADANHGAAYANVARVGQHGYLELVSPSTGAPVAGPPAVGSRIIIAAPANSALGILGLVAATTNGAAADAGNLLPEGTIMWLSAPQNFVWHYTTSEPGVSQNGIRMFTKFNQATDRIETDVYSFQDATIDEPKWMVVANNIRIARPGIVPVNP